MTALVKKPLLTVCLITYNQAPYIKESLDSILTQETNFLWELVIADDYSTDGTREILKEYKSRFPERIHLILQKHNVGPESNWLDLIAYPKTKYVVYTEGDDYFTDVSKFQRQVDFLEAHPHMSLCFHPVKIIYSDGPEKDEIFPTPDRRFHKDILKLKDLLTANFIQTNSVMYRWRFIKEDIKAVYPRGIAPGDWFLHILHAEVGDIGFIDRTMSVYRRHAAGLWWGTYNKKNEFWKKYGLPWLQFYVELLRLYGSKKELRQIIEGSMINLLNDISKADEQYHNDLFYRALLSFPEAAEVYVTNLRAQLADLHNHADKQAKLIQHYVGLSEELQAENQVLKNEFLVRLSRNIKKPLKRSHR